MAKKGQKKGIKMKNKNQWTEARVEKLIKWHDHYMGDPKCYQKIAGRLRTTKDAVYSKLGRMGRVDAKWAADYNKKSRR